jgi:hypothetical protein
VNNLGWTAAACEVAALILSASIGKHLIRAQQCAATAA